MELNYPFLTDAKTIGHIKQSKILFLMRGLSGSGKSTVVGEITKKYPESVVCSADDYFLLENGEYKFDKSQLSKAHEQCQQRAKGSCESGVNVVIIDNTNVKTWEMRCYVDLAAKNSYTVITVLPQTPWRFDPVELAKKNKHGVDEDTLKKKVEMFDDGHPYYWAWFLNLQDSNALVELAERCAAECKDLPEFASYIFQKKSGVQFGELYTRNKSSTESLHCTACYAGRSSEIKEEYSSRNAVKPSMGKRFQLSVIGFVFTPRTVGARIKLSSEQLDLWLRQDDEEDKSEMDEMAKQFDSKLKIGKSGRFRPSSGAGSRAHITLGVAPGTEAVQTGVDQLDAICRESRTGSEATTLEFTKGCVRHYNDGVFVVYLNEPVNINTIFSGEY